MTLSSQESKSISELKNLLASNYKIEKVYPPSICFGCGSKYSNSSSEMPGWKNTNDSCLQRGSTCIKGIKNLYIDLM
jgi:hypothetical protein